MELLPHQVEPDGDWICWILSGGRGAGKTTALAHAVVRAAEADDQSIAVIALRHQLRYTLEKIFELCPDSSVYRTSLDRIKLPNGSLISGLFVNPEEVRGYDFDLVACENFNDWPGPTKIEMADWETKAKAAREAGLPFGGPDSKAQRMLYECWMAMGTAARPRLIIAANLEDNGGDSQRHVRDLTLYALRKNCVVTEP